MDKVKLSGERMARLLLACLGLCEIEEIYINGTETVKVVCKVKHKEHFEILNIAPLDDSPNFTDWNVEENGEDLKTLSFSYLNTKYDYMLDTLAMDAEDFGCIFKMFFSRVFGGADVNEVYIDDSTGYVEIKVEFESYDKVPLEIDRRAMKYLVMSGFTLKILSSQYGKNIIQLY